MRGPSPWFLLLLLSCFARSASAAEAAQADSLGPLPLHLVGEAGIGWMQSPVDIRRRYKAGLDAAVSLELRGRRRIALSARGEYHDFPNAAGLYSGYYNACGAYPTGYANINLVSGRAFDIVLAPMLRVTDDWWLDAGAGYGYFDSGYSSGQKFIDGATGQTITVPGSTGWGAVVAAGLRYEFQPNVRDHILVGARWYQMSRDTRTLQCFRLGAGYRFQ